MIGEVVGKLIADKYRVVRLISERESGDLYLGKNEMLDRPVTLKILSPALAIDNRWVKTFVNEARASSTITHPNVINITDFGTDAKGFSYAVFEDIRGLPLSEILAAEPVIDEQRAVSTVRQAAAAIAAAHEKKIIHGRIDPRTVFVDRQDDETDLVK